MKLHPEAFFSFPQPTQYDIIDFCFLQIQPFSQKRHGNTKPFSVTSSGHAIQLFGGEKGRNGDPNGTGLGKYCFDATSCVSSEESDTLYSL